MLRNAVGILTQKYNVSRFYWTELPSSSINPSSLINLRVPTVIVLPMQEVHFVQINWSTLADSETRESQKRSGKSTDSVAQLCTHEEEGDDSEDSKH